MTSTELQVGLPYCPPQSQEPALHTTRPQRCNPLALVEILFMLGEHLPRSTVVVCLRVCRMWHQELLPWVWSSIKFREAESLPHLGALETHAPLVRKLHITDNNCVTLWNTIHLPGLTALYISIPGCKGEIAELIRRHQSTLLFLNIFYSLTPELLDAVLGCQRLEKLQHLKAAFDDSQWTIMYEKLLHRLKALTLTGPLLMIQRTEDCTDLVLGIKGMDPFSVWESAPVGRIQDLTLRGEDLHAHFGIIRKCPDLVRLNWCSPACSLVFTPMRLMVQELQYGVGWDRLESLILQQPFSNDHFAVLIKNLPGLTALDLSGSNFNRQSWHLLKGSALANRLRSLALTRCHFLPGITLHDILCTLRALNIFRAELISQADLEEDKRPWVCCALKEMRVCFSPVSKAYEDAIALRLSLLTELQALDLDGSRLSLYLSIDGQENEVGCLDRLRTLRSITNFRVLLSNVAWNNTEFEWVMEHWPKLRSLCVPVSRNDFGILAARIKKY